MTSPYFWASWYVLDAQVDLMDKLEEFQKRPTQYLSKEGLGRIGAADFVLIASVAGRQ